MVSYVTRDMKDQMTTISRRCSIVSMFAVVFARNSGMLRAQGLTDYKPGEGGGPITGSASGGEAASAAPTRERWPAFLGTLARRLLLVALAVFLTGCTIIAPVKPISDTCYFFSTSSNAACKAKAEASHCTRYIYDAPSLDCTGYECAGTSQSVMDIWSGDMRTAYYKCGNTSIIKDPSPDLPWSAAGPESVFSPTRPTTKPGTAPVAGEAATGFPVTPAAAQFLAASAPAITEFSLPRPVSQPGPIIVADGQIVFGETAPCVSPCLSVMFATIDSVGVITEHTLPSANPERRFMGLAPRPGGQGVCVGVTQRFYEGTRDVDKILCTNTNTGTIREYNVPIIGSVIADLALGADGKIWFTDAQLDGIGRLDYNTYVMQASYLEPGTFLGLAAITNGPDGALWFTSANGNQIGRIATSSLGLKTIPTPDSQPAGITTGPDGALWFTEFKGNKIGRITPAGAITEFPLPTPDAQPLGITAGPDGALWFTEFNANQIGRISTSGAITEYVIPTANSQPAGIVAGPDGNIWFTEFQGNKIGRLKNDWKRRASVFLPFISNILPITQAPPGAGRQCTGPVWPDFYVR
jgi:virginiamycin B lyase